MTKDEAKTKWCPHGAGVIELARVTERGVESVDGQKSKARCIGSACMAWRWSIVGTGPFFDDAPSKTDGYCGLAGKP